MRKTAMLCCSFLIIFSTSVFAQFDKQINTKQYGPNISYKEIYLGGGVNFLPFLMDGHGANFWFGTSNFRFNSEYYKLNIPDTFFRDGFKDGMVERAIRFSVDYFFNNSLSDIYFPFGVEVWKQSVGHINTTSRAEYDTIFLSAGIGYLFRFSKNIYFDTRFSINANLSEEGNIFVGQYIMTPDKAGYSGFIGFGLLF